MVLGSATARLTWKGLYLDRTDKASSCKATLYVLFCYRSKKGLLERTEELKLAHVVDGHPHQALDLAAICLLKWPKAANI